MHFVGDRPEMNDRRTAPCRGDRPERNLLRPALEHLLAASRSVDIVDPGCLACREHTHFDLGQRREVELIAGGGHYSHMQSEGSGGETGIGHRAAEPFLPSNGIRRAVPGGAAADGQGPVGAPDPHVWQSVGHVMEMVEAMRDALMEADASHAEIYRARAEQFLLQLGELDAWAFEQTASLPAEQRRLVTNHDSLGYFAERYGFELLGSLLPLSTEAGSASAQNIARLVDLIKASGVPAIFGESISSDRLLQQVAREAGVEAVGSLYTDSLGPPGSTADTYLKMMRHNVETIVGALARNR